MRIAFLDLAAARAEVADELDDAYRTVMDSGRYLFGAQLEAFEREFARFSGATDCAAVGSGLDALVFCLRSIGVGPGDEVIVPTNTTVLTWLAVAAVGAVPVGVEPDDATLTLDPNRLTEALSARTRAVVPVHLYGRPAAMTRIVPWAREHGLRVIADAAQAHGATIDGIPVGAVGDAVAWSFYPSKNLGAFSDGGAVTSNAPELIDHVRRLRNYGSRARDDVVEVGANSRLDELQAAFLRVRLRHLESWNDRRRVLADRYGRALADLDIVLPPADDASVRSAWHLFVVRVGDRAAVRSALAERGIETLVHYPVPPWSHPVFADLHVKEGTFPVAERLANEVLSLPLGPHLRPEEADDVVAALRGVAAT